MKRPVARISADPHGDCSYACDVGGEEVATELVEISSCALVVLGRSWVGVPGEDLGVAERDTGIEAAGNGGVARGHRVGTERE